MAIKVDSFQDHLGEISQLVHIDSFQDPSYMATFDSFQDHHVAYMANHQKLTPFKTPVNYSQIDSFQDHLIGLYSVSFSMGETPQIDSIKTPWESTFRKLLLSRPYVHSVFWTHFKTIYGLYVIFSEIDSFQDHSEEEKKNRTHCS